MRISDQIRSETNRLLTLSLNVSIVGSASRRCKRLTVTLPQPSTLPADGPSGEISMITELPSAGESVSRGALPPATTTVRSVTSEELFQGQREILIQHAGETYRLRLTRNDKLILNK